MLNEHTVNITDAITILDDFFRFYSDEAIKINKESYILWTDVRNSLIEWYDEKHVKYSEPSTKRDIDDAAVYRAIKLINESGPKVWVNEEISVKWEKLSAVLSYWIKFYDVFKNHQF